MTFEDAYRTALEMLTQRGQLINGHLLRLVENDKALFREVRDALIRNGEAEDRSGVGLASKRVPVSTHGQAEFANNRLSEPFERGKGFPVDQEVDAADDSSAESDWWVMSAGVTRGPYDLETISLMQDRGDLAPGDVIRCGVRGLWKQPSQIQRLARRVRAKSDFNSLATPTTNPSGLIERRMGAASSDLSRTESAIAAIPAQPPTESVAPYVPPDKIWSMGHQRPSRMREVWNSFATICGGSRRLAQVLVAVSLMSLFVYWWRQPPPSRVVYQEFADCYSTLQKLRERRIGRSEWAPTVTRFRPRITSIVSRLQFRHSPVEKELYQAGTLGLLPLLDVPADPTTAERIFDKHMAAARQHIDNKPVQELTKFK